MHLATVEAVITILAVASDPFIQQVIRYDPCPQLLESGTALMPRTNNYTQTGIHTGALQESLDLPMQAAIYEGIYNSSFPVQPTYTSGNYTFPEYRTVAMCNDCQDIHSRVNALCNKTTSLGGGELCAWKLPSGLNLTFGTPHVMTMAPARFPNGSYSFAFEGFATTEIMSFTNILDSNQSNNVN